MHYVIGLGNPEARYEHTRHNVGRDFVRALCDQANVDGWNNDRHARALRASRTFDGKEVALVLPETYMNRSGETVSYLLHKEHASTQDLIVVYDDVDIPFGTFKLSASGGAGGHNGIRSIVSVIDTPSFARVRIGIAPTSFWTGKTVRPSGGGALERFVLGSFSKKEQQVLAELIPSITSAIEIIVNEGIASAMNKFN